MMCKTSSYIRTSKLIKVSLLKCVAACRFQREGLRVLPYIGSDGDERLLQKFEGFQTFIGYNAFKAISSTQILLTANWSHLGVNLNKNAKN